MIFLFINSGGRVDDYVLVGLSEENMEDKAMLNKLTRRVCNQHLELSGGWSYSVQQASEEDLVIINIIFGSEVSKLYMFFMTSPLQSLFQAKAMPWVKISPREGFVSKGHSWSGGEIGLLQVDCGEKDCTR